MTDPVIGATRLGGAATRAELLAEGVSRRAAGRAVAVGTLLAGDAALWVPGSDATLVLACRTRSWLTCVSALARWSLPLLVEPSVPHLATAHPRSTRQARWHRLRDAVPRDRGTDVRTRSLDPLAAVAQALRCLPRREALVVADSALRVGLVTRSELSGVIAEHDPQGARWAVRHADPRAGSVLESALRHDLIAAGLTDIRPQAYLPGVGRVDLLLRGWLVVEADGFEHHSARADFLLDRRRLSVAAATGHVTLRFGYSAIVHRPDEVIGCIRATLERFERTPAHRTAGDTGHLPWSGADAS